MSDFLNEIKEDLEREKYARLWNKYAYILIMAAVLVVVGTAGGVWWKNHTSEQQKKAGNSFYQALSLESQDAPKSLALLEDVRKDKIKGFSSLAGIKEAEILTKQGQHDKAIAIYKEIAASKSNDPAIRDLALLLSTNLRLATGKADKSDDATLQELTGEDRPWRYSALEAQGLRALSLNNKQAARDIFTALTKDPLTPEGLRSRAEQVLVVIGETTETGSKK